jgi:hypothetical protein
MSPQKVVIWRLWRWYIPWLEAALTSNRGFVQRLFFTQELALSVPLGDTRIFSRELVRLRLYISKSYRGVRCPICMTMQDDAELVHANLTHQFLSLEAAENFLFVP